MIKRLLLIATVVLLLNGCFALRPQETPSVSPTGELKPVSKEVCEQLNGKVIPFYWPFSVRDSREAQCRLEPTPTVIGWIAMPVYIPLILVGVLTSPVWGPFI